MPESSILIDFVAQPLNGLLPTSTVLLYPCPVSNVQRGVLCECMMDPSVGSHERLVMLLFMFRDPSIKDGHTS